MNTSASPSAIRVLAMLPMFCLTGCALGSFATVPSPIEPVVVSPPTAGSVYGGHAPLVGALVYVLTPSATANYGQSSSLMDGDTQNGSRTPSGTGNGLVASGGKYGYHYVTTDNTGAFSLTGDYACTVDQPVYIAAVGGSPTYPASSNTFSISSVAVSGASGAYTLTFTTTATENAYIGEQVTFSGMASAGNLSDLNTGTYTIVATNLSTNTFAVTDTDTHTLTAETEGSATATLQPTNNPAAINMAYLGLCPSSGSFAGALSYVYMNEVSTAALAYATAAFGTDAFHIGVNYASTSALNTAYPAYVWKGLLQAFNNATNLYDIQGGELSTSYAGEGHIARITTPGGNGTVPQTTLDAIGNILAACVDSNNTSGSASPQCTSLFSTATSDGTTTGTAPGDIATVAFNLAHYPAGVGNSSFVSTLYSLPEGNVPFTPHLTAQPNDFTVAIGFTAPASSGSSTNMLSAPVGVVVDAGTYVGTESTFSTGDAAESVWISEMTTGVIKLNAATGVPDYTLDTDMAAAINTRSVSIDTSNNAWIASESNVTPLVTPGQGPIYEYSPTDVLLLQENIAYAGGGGPQGSNFDASGNIIVVLSSDDILVKLDSTGANVPAPGGATGSPWANNSCMQASGTVTVSTNGYVFSPNHSSGNLCVYNGTTAALAYTVTGGAYTGLGPAYMSVDAAGNVWGTSSSGNKLLGYTVGGTSVTTTLTGGGLNAPVATAVDGAGTIWVGSSGNASVSAFRYNGGSSYTALSPVANTTSGNTSVTTGGYYPQNFVAHGSDPAIDRAGNVWIAQENQTTPNGTIYEIIGLAAPTVNPISYALKNSLFGTRPF